MECDAQDIGLLEEVRGRALSYSRLYILEWNFLNRDHLGDT